MKRKAILRVNWDDPVLNRTRCKHCGMERRDHSIDTARCMLKGKDWYLGMTFEPVQFVARNVLEPVC